jgi:hypothetical protein
LWERPEEGSVTNYMVETLSLSDGRAANYCSCIGHHSDVTNTFFSFWAGCFPDVTRDYSLYYRVAANTKDSQSDFIAGPSTTVTLEAPPKTKSLSVETVAATDKWDLRLSWEYQDTDNYYPVCYHTTVTPPCGTASTRIVRCVKLHALLYGYIYNVVSNVAALTVMSYVILHMHFYLQIRNTLDVPKVFHLQNSYCINYLTPEFFASTSFHELLYNM